VPFGVDVEIHVRSAHPQPVRHGSAAALAIRRALPGEAVHRGAIDLTLPTFGLLIGAGVVGEMEAEKVASIRCEQSAGVAQVGAGRLVTVQVAEGGDQVERDVRSEEHTSELQSRENLVCRLLLEKKKNNLRKTRRTK